MELPTISTDVRRGGNFESANFKIESNAFTFKILSSGLYSNKAQAIIRELSCNAWDAHVAAGTTDKPFVLYLPNDNELTFRIRDFGTGLSHEDVMDLYTTYMRSTKRQTNDQTGCFGLGSKSPFAYTDNFTVISFFGGFKRSYSLFINDSGYPEIVAMGDAQASDEPNGMDISFPVKRKDIHDFKRAAEKVLRPFSTQPIVKGARYFEPLEYPEPLVEGSNWTVFKQWPDYRSSQLIAVMGNVEYPLEEQSDFSPAAKTVLKLPIRIEFPLGSFGMNPGRELIEWDDFSKDNVNQILEDVYDEIVVWINSEISSASTLWEARKKVWTLLHNSTLSKIRKSTVAEWKGIKVTPTIKVPNDVEVLKLVRGERIKDGIHSPTCSTSRVTTIDPVETEFFLHDFKSSAYRCGSYVRDNLSDGDHIYLIEPENKKAYKAFLKHVGISSKEIKFASSIPKKKRTSNGGGGGGSSVHARTKSKVFKHNGRRHGSADTHWSKTEVEVEDGGIFVEISRYKVVDQLSHSKDFGMDPGVIGRSLECLATLGISVEVIGIKSAKIDKFRGKKGWISFDKFVQDKVKEIWDADSDLRAAYDFYIRNGKNNERAIGFTNAALKFQEKLAEDGYDLEGKKSYFMKFFTLFRRLKDKQSKAEAILGLKAWYEKQYTPVTVKKTPTNYVRLVTDKYPMLKVTVEGRSRYDSGDWIWSAHEKSVREYIKFMDGLRAQGIEV